MHTYKSLVSSPIKHMGRSEAPLSRDQKEETLGETNRKHSEFVGLRFNLSKGG